MGLFFIYSIKLAFCLTAFYLLYKLLLSRDGRFGKSCLLLLFHVMLCLRLVASCFSGLDIGLFSKRIPFTL